MLEEAYKTGQFKGHEITDAKRLIDTFGVVVACL